MSKAYVYLSRSCDWECFVCEQPQDLTADDDLYLAGEVNSLPELMWLLEDNGFDYEYFYEYVDNCLSHRLFNMLNKDGEY